jgi:glycosyltransferase involved in cell wall biosynthesis
MTQRHSLDKAALEAMACGCLLLTTNEAYAEVLGEHACLLVRPDASAEALAGAIEALAALPVERRAKIGLELRDVVARQHSLPRMMDRIVEQMGAAAERRSQ